MGNLHSVKSRFSRSSGGRVNFSYSPLWGLRWRRLAFAGALGHIGAVQATAVVGLMQQQQQQPAVASRGDSTPQSVRLLLLMVGGALGQLAAVPLTTLVAFMQTVGLKGLLAPDFSLKRFVMSMRAGLVSRMSWTGFEKMVKQWVEEVLRTLIAEDGRLGDVSTRVASGALAGAAQGLISTAPERFMLLRTLNPTTPPMEVLRTVASSPLRGLAYCLMRDVPFCALVFPGVHFLSRALEEIADMSRATANFVAGAFCGAFAAALVTPADALKTRAQAGVASPLPTSLIERALVLYATAPLRFPRSLIVFGILFAWNEYCRQFFQRSTSARKV